MRDFMANQFSGRLELVYRDMRIISGVLDHQASFLKSASGRTFFAITRRTDEIKNDESSWEKTK